ncbi:ferredoxin [Nocardia sp. NBC_01377]|uniref:ferredoxin n=1 Tax=Nocardia sp. NBC_01377 TaxID=2903595 RepID=UPI00325440BF
MSNWSVDADREICIGSGMCAMYAPGTFTQDDEAKVVLLDAPTDRVEAVRIAVEACPAAALELVIDKQGA